MIPNTEKRKRVSERKEDNFVILPISLSDIFNSTKSFFDENFRGAVITEKDEIFDGYTEVSPTGIAYYFKLLLNAVFGETPLRVSMSLLNGEFIIKTEWQTLREIPKSDIDELVTVSRLSGFSLDFLNDGERSFAIARLKVAKQKYLALYAISFEKMLESYNKVFFM